jgi:hypothetical protein
MYERFTGHRIGQVPEAASRCGEPQVRMESRWLAIREGEPVFWLLRIQAHKKRLNVPLHSTVEMFRLKRLCGGGERSLFKKFRARRATHIEMTYGSSSLYRADTATFPLQKRRPKHIQTSNLAKVFYREAGGLCSSCLRDLRNQNVQT